MDDDEDEDEDERKAGTSDAMQTEEAMCGGRARVGVVGVGVGVAGVDDTVLEAEADSSALERAEAERAGEDGMESECERADPPEGHAHTHEAGSELDKLADATGSEHVSATVAELLVAVVMTGATSLPVSVRAALGNDTPGSDAVRRRVVGRAVVAVLT